MAGDEVLMSLKGIQKSFPGVLAINNVSLDLFKGEVHVLLGENGAGKSTLVKIIAGVLNRNAGEIWFDGKCVDFKNVREAQDAGISIIHQELNLLPERTIAQNIFIGREPRKKGKPYEVDYKKMVQDSQKLMNDLGLALDPDMQIKNISIAQQQMVEVVRALSNRIKLIIMDEPTSSLTRREIQKLFGIIETLKKKGISIIYISHRMDEIKEVGDRVTIMRDGQTIDTVRVPEMNMDDVIFKMVGRKISNLYARHYQEPRKEVLRTDHLTGLRFRDVNITVHEGEIVSLAGLVGAGRTEIAKALFGYEPILKGTYYLCGAEVKKPTPKRCVKLGMAFLPENRKEEGLIIQMPIWKNIVSASLQGASKGGVLQKKQELAIAQRYKDELKIAAPDVNKEVIELSGGNQQKVVVGKWLATQSKFFIFDEPTRGIDIGAKAEIYELLDELVAQKAGILMISSEINEVIGISDRTYVMREGMVSMELMNRVDITKEKIMSYAIGGSEKC